MKLMTSCDVLGFTTARSFPIMPSAGSIASMLIATTDINEAINIMNSVMGKLGGFKGYRSKSLAHYFPAIHPKRTWMIFIHASGISKK
jgi:hypothetical protein